MPDSARVLRRMRVLRGMKQSHVAELLSVTQATVSRWERGLLRPSPAQMSALLALLAAPPAGSRDAALKRLIETSMRRVHLICDTTHRLLAASPARSAEWGVPADELLGRSLWRFASAEIEAAESRLESLGWFEAQVPAVAFRTGATLDPVVPVASGQVLWERLRLDDGSDARLVTTFGDAEPLPPDVMRL
jgi:transcriptional regulator with XRE-family HTH domain